jgi:hypothetical protein
MATDPHLRLCGHCNQLQKALLTRNVYRLIVFYYSIYWQQLATFLRVQKAKVDHKRLFEG